MHEHLVLCPVHGTPLGLRVSGFGPWYACNADPTCDYRVGAHKGSGEPLGTPTNAAGREARKRAHAAFDVLWRRDYDGNSRRRTRAYNWLAVVLGLTEEACHIAKFDVPQCRAVEEACARLVASNAHGPYPALLLHAAFAPTGNAAEAEREKGLPLWELT